MVETDAGQTLVYAPTPDETISVDFGERRGVRDKPSNGIYREREFDGTVTVTATIRGRVPTGKLWHDSDAAPLVVMKREHARIIFDALHSSLDFGSGFLDDDAVEALRALAVLIGVNPTEGTSSEYQSQYVHHFNGEHGPKHDPATCWDCRT